VRFCVFLENDKPDLRHIFSGFKRKHLFLFILTCIEKQYARPLSKALGTTPVFCAKPTGRRTNLYHELGNYAKTTVPGDYWDNWASIKYFP